MTNTHPLRVLRKSRCLTQAQLADKAGLHRLAINHIETGGARLIRLSNLRAIADALGVTWRDIHGPGQPLLADTDEDLAEITGGAPTVCLCELDDPLGALASQLGVERSAALEWLKDLAASEVAA